MASNIFLKPLDTRSNEETNFILRSFCSEEAKLFWGPNLINADSFEELSHIFNAQWGAYIIYVGFYQNIPASIYAIASISLNHKRAELLVFVENKFRGMHYTFDWWVQFLLQIRKKGIHRLYAKVYAGNKVCLNNISKFMFEECGLLPEYLWINGEFQDVHIFSRTTELSNLENKWNIKKYERSC